MRKALLGCLVLASSVASADNAPSLSTKLANWAAPVRASKDARGVRTVTIGKLRGETRPFRVERSAPDGTRVVLERLTHVIDDVPLHAIVRTVTKPNGDTTRTTKLLDGSGQATIELSTSAAPKRLSLAGARAAAVMRSPLTRFGIMAGTIALATGVYGAADSLQYGPAFAKAVGLKSLALGGVLGPMGSIALLADSPRAKVVTTKTVASLE